MKRSANVMKRLNTYTVQCVIFFAGGFETMREYFRRYGNLIQSLWECLSAVMGNPFSRYGNPVPPREEGVGLIIADY